MDYNKLINEIKRDNLKPIYLFTGHEEYLMHEALDILKDKYVEESFESLNYAIIDGKSMTFDNILNACETLPFMATKKIVVVRDISEIMDNAEADFDKTMASYIETLDNYLCLIIMDRSSNLKKTSRIYKTAKKMNTVVDFKKLQGLELNNWIKDKLKKHNKEILGSNLYYLIQSSKYSEYNSTKTLYDLENELLKLVNYAYSKEISKEDIDSCFIKTLDTNIFNLLNSISNKDSDNALRIFNEMHISNEPIQRILFMITRQIRLVLGYKMYKEKGYGEREIQSKLKVKPYEFKKIASQGYSLTEAQLIKTLNYILEIDIKQKTSSHDDKLGLEMLIINLCHLI